MENDTKEYKDWAAEKEQADQKLATQIERESLPTLEEMQNELYQHNAAIHREWELDYEREQRADHRTSTQAQLCW